MYDDYISFCMDYLKINGVIIDLECTPADEWGVDDAEAYCCELGSFGPLKVFEIEYHEGLESDFTAFHKMIAHELVHVMQTMRGDEFRYDLPYNKQPHEIEAYQMQEEMWSAWVNKGVNK